MTSSTLSQLLSDYIHRRKLRDEAAAMKAEAEKDLQIVTAKLIDQMQAEHVSSMTLDNGLKPTLVQMTKAKPRKHDAEAVGAWIATLVPDPQSYFEPRLIERRLNALVKEQIEKGFDPSELPPELNLQSRPTLRVTGWDSNSEGSEDE